MERKVKTNKQRQGRYGKLPGLLVLMLWTLAFNLARSFSADGNAVILHNEY